MAKVAKSLTLSRQDLARALAAKKTPAYANADKWGIYSYEDTIYPQARLAFPEYNALYDTNPEFTEYFVRDLNKKDSRLVKILGDKTVDKILIGDQTMGTGQVSAEATEQPAEVTAGQGTAGSAAGGAGPVSPTAQAGGAGGGGHGPGIPPIPHVSTATMQSVQQGEAAKTMESEKITTPSQKPSAVKPAFQAPKIPAAFSSAGKNFTSRLGIFFKRNTTGILSGLFAAGGGFIGGGIAGKPGILFGAIGGGLTPSLVKSGVLNLQPGGVVSRVGNFGINSTVRLSNLVSGARSRLGGIGLPKGLGTGKKAALAFAIFGLVFGFSLFSAAFLPNQTTTPTVSASNLLDYTIPFKDPTVSPTDIKSDVKASWPNAKLENWDTIIQKSVAAGWNPAFVLALWIEESGAQGVANYDDPLGCSPGQPTEDIEVSLSCLFNNFSSFTNDQFVQFMSRYSGGPAGTPFSNNPNFPNGIKFWYSRLVPSGPGAIKTITQTLAVSSCPVPGGSISTPSYNADPQNGHCGGGYGYSCRCGTSGRRAKAIDVPTYGKSVVSPTINNQSVNWQIIVGPYSVDSQEGGGVGYTFEATLGTDKWYLDTLHMNTGLSLGQIYPSGTSIGTSVAGHIHMTMGKNLAQTPVAGTNTDCDPNWLPSDFVCK